MRPSKQNMLDCPADVKLLRDDLDSRQLEIEAAISLERALRASLPPAWRTGVD
jgi:hypothetical protein